MTETLADMVLRESYRPQTHLTYMMTRPMQDLRMALHRARRFVLDERMSAFVADLSSVPFDTAHVRQPGILDAMRYGARLPHAATWIEFDGYAFRKRLMDVAKSKTDGWGQHLAGPEEVPSRWGWLFEQHPKLDTVVTMTEFIDLSTKGVYACGSLPFTIVWNTVDEPLPWNDLDVASSTFSHGLSGYVCNYMAVRHNKPIPPTRMVQVKDDSGQLLFNTDKMVVEMGGIARYAMALLSTLSDVPVLETEVKAQKGFVARGAYRRFLDHTTLHLNVPVKRNTKLLARRLVAMARRRAHGVRGHWRLYARGEFICQSHEWGHPDERNHMKCTNERCGAWKTWIAEHQRGDASLGFVIHDYAVTHELN